MSMVKGIVCPQCKKVNPGWLEGALFRCGWTCQYCGTAMIKVWFEK